MRALLRMMDTLMPPRYQRPGYSTRRPAWRPPLVYVAALLGLYTLWMVGCGAPQKHHASKRSSDDLRVTQVFEMEPVVIHASDLDDDDRPLDSIDLRNTFDEAGAYFQAEDYARAIRLYQRVYDATHEIIWQKAALYNIGLSYENQGHWEQAAQIFDRVIEQFSTTIEGRDAYFRLAEMLAQLGEFQRIVPLMTEVLLRPDLNEDRRIEGLVRKGTAYVELRQFAEAEKTLRTAIDFDERTRRKAIDEGRRYERSKLASTGVAQAQYLIGRIYHEIFSEIRMVLPVERYKKDLADKDALFHQALKEYTAAVRTGNHYWAPQAGFQIGKLYEDYYFDILASEVPQHFTQEHRDIYFEELRKFLKPGLESALQMYERALGMAYRMGSQDDVVEDLLAHLLSLESYAKTQAGWEEEHGMIFEGKHPHSPHPAQDMVFRNEMIGNK